MNRNSKEETLNRMKELIQADPKFQNGPMDRYGPGMPVHAFAYGAETYWLLEAAMEALGGNPAGCAHILPMIDQA